MDKSLVLTNIVDNFITDVKECGFKEDTLSESTATILLANTPCIDDEDKMCFNAVVLGRNIAVMKLLFEIFKARPALLLQTKLLIDKMLSFE